MKHEGQRRKSRKLRGYFPGLPCQYQTYFRVMPAGEDSCGVELDPSQEQVGLVSSRKSSISKALSHADIPKSAFYNKKTKMDRYCDIWACKIRLIQTSTAASSCLKSGITTTSMETKSSLWLMARSTPSSARLPSSPSIISGRQSTTKMFSSL